MLGKWRAAEFPSASPPPNDTAGGTTAANTARGQTTNQTASTISDARVRGHRAGRSVPLTVLPVTGRCRLIVNCVVGRGARRPAQPTSHILQCLQRHRQTTGATTMQTDADNSGRDERRALLEQRRAAVARQLRRLAIELTDLDRQLDEIEQSER